MSSEFRSCVEVEVAVLVCSPSLIVRMVSVVHSNIELCTSIEIKRRRRRTDYLYIL